MINVEYLPRECVGNSEAELLQIISNFDPGQVGICMDVNHIMDKYQGDLLLVAVNYDEKTNEHTCEIKRFVK